MPLLTGRIGEPPEGQGEQLNPQQQAQKLFDDFRDVLFDGEEGRMLGYEWAPIIQGEQEDVRTAFLDLLREKGLLTPDAPPQPPGAGVDTRPAGPSAKVAGYNKNGVWREGDEVFIRIIKEVGGNPREFPLFVKVPTGINVDPAERDRFYNELEEERRAFMREQGVDEEEGDERKAADVRTQGGRDPIASLYINGRRDRRMPIPDEISQIIRDNPRNFSRNDIYRRWKDYATRRGFGDLLTERLHRRGWDFARAAAPAGGASARPDVISPAATASATQVGRGEPTWPEPEPTPLTFARYEGFKRRYVHEERQGGRGGGQQEREFATIHFTNGSELSTNIQAPRQDFDRNDEEKVRKFFSDLLEARRRVFSRAHKAQTEGDALNVATHRIEQRGNQTVVTFELGDSEWPAFLDNQTRDLLAKQNRTDDDNRNVRNRLRQEAERFVDREIEREYRQILWEQQRARERREKFALSRMYSPDGLVVLYTDKENPDDRTFVENGRNALVRSVVQIDGKEIDEYEVDQASKVFKAPGRRLQFLDKYDERIGIRHYTEELLEKMKAGSRERELLLEIQRRLATRGHVDTPFVLSEYEEAVVLAKDLHDKVNGADLKEAVKTLQIHLENFVVRLKFERDTLKEVLERSALFEKGNEVLVYFTTPDSEAILQGTITQLFRDPNNGAWQYIVSTEANGTYTVQEHQLRSPDMSKEEAVMGAMLDRLQRLSTILKLDETVFDDIKRELSRDELVAAFGFLAKAETIVADITVVVPLLVKEYIKDELSFLRARFEAFIHEQTRPREVQPGALQPAEQNARAIEAHLEGAEHAVSGGGHNEHGAHGGKKSGWWHLRWIVPLGIALTWLSTAGVDQEVKRPAIRDIIPDEPEPTPIAPEIPPPAPAVPAPTEAPISPTAEARRRPAVKAPERAVVTPENKTQHVAKLLHDVVNKMSKESAWVGRNMPPVAAGQDIQAFSDYYYGPFVKFFRDITPDVMSRGQKEAYRSQFVQIEAAIARAKQAMQTEQSLQEAGRAAVKQDAIVEKLHRAESGGVSDRVTYWKLIDTAIKDKYADDADAQARLRRTSAALLDIRQAFHDLGEKIENDKKLNERERGIYLTKLTRLRERQLGDFGDLLNRVKKGEAVEGFVPALEASTRKFVAIPDAAQRKIEYDEYVADLLTDATSPTEGVTPFKVRMFEIAAAAELRRGIEAPEVPALTVDRPVRALSGNVLEALDVRGTPHRLTLPEGVTVNAAIGRGREVRFISGNRQVDGAVITDQDGNFGMVVEGSARPLADVLRELQQGR
ncbi:MAG: hypothetical protein Q7S89_03695 [bacterium]|nr:hypothetical protein [bacterium]